MTDPGAGRSAATTVFAGLADSVLLLYLFSQLWLRGDSVYTLAVSVGISICIWTVYRLEVRPRIFRDNLGGVPTVPVSTFLVLPVEPLLKDGSLQGGYPLLWHSTAQFSKPRGEAFRRMMMSIPNSGLIHLRGFLGRDCILLTSPEALAEVLVRHPYSYTKPVGARNLFQRLFGHSLIIAEGDEHRRLRKLMQPSFNYRRVQALAPLLWSKATAMNAALRKQCISEETNSTLRTTNICDWSSKAMLDAIGIAMLGTDFKSLQESNRMIELYETVTSTEPSVQAVFMASALLPNWMTKHLPGSAARRLATAGKALRQECMKKIDEARKNDEKLDGDDFLLSMVKSRTFTDEQLVDQFLLILGAGYEATTAAFAWTIWLLATHPEWQKRLREEINAKFSLSCSRDESEEEFTLMDFENLPILHAVCSEALRFMPPTPITTRVAAHDTSILGTHISKGTRIFIVPYACNRSTAFYGPTAETFDPSRWFDINGRVNNNGGADSNYAFLTFLHGPRKCIGDGYARLALRAFVAAFVRAFEFEMADKSNSPVPGGILATKPVNGLHLKLRMCGSAY